mmetsp:Transcript_16781/g.30437  ORF Transcript_16781/g.30437 Transcript_16781/m.30437 type:complete len:206 (+) Transcript_16781:797-1414(+)
MLIDGKAGLLHRRNCGVLGGCLEDARGLAIGCGGVAISSPLFFVGLVSGIAVFAVVTAIDGGVVFFRAIHGGCRGGHLALFTAEGILLLGGRRFSICHAIHTCHCHAIHTSSLIPSFALSHSSPFRFSSRRGRFISGHPPLIRTSRQTAHGTLPILRITSARRTSPRIIIPIVHPAVRAAARGGSSRYVLFARGGGCGGGDCGFR